jgi:hypothetical protein
VKQPWRKEWRKYSPPQLREWSPKVDDPRQIDLLEYMDRKEIGAGFALLDEAIKQKLNED